MMLGSIVIIGALGFYLIEEQWGILESIYWTIVTITTVGYGDVTPHTELGKIFSIFLMVVGIGSILYVLTVVGRNIVEGKIWEVFSRSGKREEVEGMEDHLIVCGYGDVGRALTQELLLANEKVVIVDIDEGTLIEEVPQKPYIVGDATKEDVLESAGIERAMGLFATLPSDSDNVLLTLNAKDLNPGLRVISKAETREGAKHLRRAGSEAVISPEREGGLRMARSFLHPEITSLYDHLLMGDVGRAEAVQVPEGGVLDGKTIEESKMGEEIGVSIITIRREGELITNPQPGQVMKGGDTLIVMGTLSQIKKLRERFAQQ